VVEEVDPVEENVELVLLLVEVRLRVELRVKVKDLDEVVDNVEV